MSKKNKKTEQRIIDPASSYEELETALQDGHTVELCSVGPNSEAVDWRPVDKIYREWSVGRYRILVNPTTKDTEVESNG